MYLGGIGSVRSSTEADDRLRLCNIEFFQNCRCRFCRICRLNNCLFFGPIRNGFECVQRGPDVGPGGLDAQLGSPLDHECQNA